MSSEEPTASSENPSYASRDQMRALAHPLRIEIMDRVGRRGTARAADVAADLGVPANSVSYHLRILARGGVIQEAPEAARDRRDRVWKLVQTGFADHQDQRSDNDPHSRDADYMAASGEMSLAAFEWMRSAWNAEVARAATEGVLPEEGLGTLSATSLRLSIDQARELNRRIQGVIHEYDRLNRDEHGVDRPGDPDSEGQASTFRVMWAAVAERRSPDATP